MTAAVPADMDARARVYFVLCKNCVKAHEVNLDDVERKQLKNTEQIMVFISVCPFCGNEGVFQGPDVPSADNFFAKDLRMRSAENIELRRRLKRTEEKLKATEQRVQYTEQQKTRLSNKVRKLSEECTKLADSIHAGNLPHGASPSNIRLEPKDKTRLPYK